MAEQALEPVAVEPEQDTSYQLLSGTQKCAILMLLLGEDEARERLEKYLETLQSPDVEVLSVKISTIDSQILPIAREHAAGVTDLKPEAHGRIIARSDGARP